MPGKRDDLLGEKNETRRKRTRCTEKERETPWRVDGMRREKAGKDGERAVRDGKKAVIPSEARESRAGDDGP